MQDVNKLLIDAMSATESGDVPLTVSTFVERFDKQAFSGRETWLKAFALTMYEAGRLDGIDQCKSERWTDAMEQLPTDDQFPVLASFEDFGGRGPVSTSGVCELFYMEKDDDGEWVTSASMPFAPVRAWMPFPAPFVKED